MDRLQSTIEALRNVLEECEEVIFACLFGSTASGRTHRLCDVDVAIYVDREAKERRDRDTPWGYLADITGRLMQALETNDINVVILNDAPPLLADRVARSGRLILSRDEACRLRWLVETKSRYCDLVFLRRTLRKTLEERVRSGRFGT